MNFRSAANHASLGITVFVWDYLCAPRHGGEPCELEKRCGGVYLNRFPLPNTGDSDSLACEFVESFFAPNQLVAPVAVHQNVAGALPDAYARTLCRTQMRILQMTGAATGVSHHSLVEPTRRNFWSSW